MVGAENLGPGQPGEIGVRPVLADRYQLGPVLGRGGMAVVYQGVDGRLDRQVAIKVLRADLAADPGLRSRFEAEARSAARLVHPNVVSVFDTGESGGRPYIVMERLSGETLADLIGAGPLAEGQVIGMGAEVLAALSMAHHNPARSHPASIPGAHPCNAGRRFLASVRLAVVIGDQAAAPAVPVAAHARAVEFY